jgi:hypothetical protein
MIARSQILRLGLAASALAFAGSNVSAQTLQSQNPWRSATPLTVEGYHAHYRLDAAGDDRIGMDGIGARLLWRGGLRFAGADALRERSAVGLFAEYAPTQSGGFSLLHAGLQGDLNLTPAPLFGRVTPIASLAAGALWTDVDDETKAVGSGFPLAARSSTTLALTPAIGMRMDLWRQLGLRMDVRDVITFRHKTLHNYQFATGLSFAF